VHAHANKHTHMLLVKVQSSYVQPRNTVIYRIILCKQIQYLLIWEIKTITFFMDCISQIFVYLQLQCHHVEVNV
jgi:hypothetical protein